jgi:hypothetical protein
MARRRAVIEREDGTEEVTIVDPENDTAALGDFDYIEAAGDDVVWNVKRMKTAEEMSPGGKTDLWVTKFQGKIDAEAFRNKYGGGMFRFHGKHPDGTFYGQRDVEIAGPRMNYSQPNSATPVVSSQIASIGANVLDPFQQRQLELLESMNKRLDALEHSKSNGNDLTELVQSLAALDALRSRGDHNQAPEDAGELIKTVMDAFRQGITIGQEREPSSQPQGTDYVSIIERVAPVVEKILDRAGEARRARIMNAGARPQPATRSSAEPIETPRAAPGRGESLTIDPTVFATIQALARAIVRGVPPEDFAVTLETLLPDEQLFQLRIATGEQVMQNLAQAGTLPEILRTPHAVGYVDQVLGALRNPDEPEAEEPPQ